MAFDSFLCDFAFSLDGDDADLVGGTIFYWSNQGLTLPTMQVLNMSIGGRRQAQVEAILQQSWQTQRVVLHTDTDSVLTDPATLGIDFDLSATAVAATEQTTQATLTSLIAFWQGCHCVQPQWRLDNEKMEAYLREIEPQLTTPAVNAGVLFQDGRLHATPAVAGTAIDIAKTIAYLQAHGSLVVENGLLPVALRAAEPTVLSTADWVAQENGRLDTTLTLPLFDPIKGTNNEVSISPEHWNLWLTLNGQDEPEWQIEESALSQFTAEQITFEDHRYIDSAEAGVMLTAVLQAHLLGETISPTPLRIYHGPQVHEVQSGDTFARIGRVYGVPYPWLQQANPDVTDLAIGQLITVPSIDAFLPLPVIRHKRLVVSIAEQTMWAYEDDALIWEWTISTGIDSSPTWPGVYQVRSHEENAYAGNWDLWMPNFMGIYQPVPTSEFMNGFHGFPTRGGSNLLWTNSLGTQVTYGCVLVGNEQMTQLYTWAEEGTVVEIRP